jgi:hypothetical protein
MDVSTFFLKIRLNLALYNIYLIRFILNLLIISFFREFNIPSDSGILVLITIKHNEIILLKIVLNVEL